MTNKEINLLSTILTKDQKPKTPSNERNNFTMIYKKLTEKEKIRRANKDNNNINNR